MARWDYGLRIHQGPLYTAQNRSLHSLTFHDEYNFSSQCHSSAQNSSVSFCIIVLSLEIEYLHNLLPHLASCCILPSCTQTEIWNMFYTVSKVVSPFLYLGYSLCPKPQLPFQLCFSTCRVCDDCLLMTHRVYCHHLHNIFWSSIFSHSIQARCEMRSPPPSLLLLLPSFPQGLSQQCICICLVSVILARVIHDSSCTCLMETFLGWNWEGFFWLGHRAAYWRHLKVRILGRKGGQLVELFPHFVIDYAHREDSRVIHIIRSETYKVGDVQWSFWLKSFFIKLCFAEYWKCFTGASRRLCRSERSGWTRVCICYSCSQSRSQL